MTSLTFDELTISWYMCFRDLDEKVKTIQDGLPGRHMHPVSAIVKDLGFNNVRALTISLRRVFGSTWARDLGAHKLGRSETWHFETREILHQTSQRHAELSMI